MKLTPELKKKIERDMTCVQRVLRAVEIVHVEEKIDNEELLYLLSMILGMRVAEERVETLW